jgi:hypothetical protein
VVQGQAQELERGVEDLGQLLGTLDRRADPQNLPRVSPRSPGPRTVRLLGGGDYGTAFAERAEIYNLVRDAKITGFAIVSATATASGPDMRLRNFRPASSSRSA